MLGWQIVINVAEEGVFALCIDAGDGLSVLLELLELEPVVHCIADDLLQGLNLGDFLVENLLVSLDVVGQRDFVPLVADPALSGVGPVRALFDVFMAEDSSEDCLVHVAGHWVLHQSIVGDLIDTHEHKS